MVAPPAHLPRRPRLNLLHLNADTAFIRLRLLAGKGGSSGKLQRSAIGHGNWPKFSGRVEIFLRLCAGGLGVEPICLRRDRAGKPPKPVLLMPMAVAVPPPEAGSEARPIFGPARGQVRILFQLRFPLLREPQEPACCCRGPSGELFPRPQTHRRPLLLKTIGSEWKPEERDKPFGGDTRRPANPAHRSRVHQGLARLRSSRCRIVFLSLHRSEGFGRGPRRGDAAGQAGDRDRLLRKPAIFSRRRRRRSSSAMSWCRWGPKEYPGGARSRSGRNPTSIRPRGAMRSIFADAAHAERPW